MRVSVSSGVGAGLLSIALACSNSDGSSGASSGTAGQSGGGASGGGNVAAGAGPAAGQGAGGTGANTAGQSAGGSAGSANLAGQSAGGNGAGGTMSGGQSGGGGADTSGGATSAQEQSEFADLYRLADALCRSGTVDVELNLAGVELNGVSFLSRSFDDVVDGDVRHVTVAGLNDSFVLRLTWPASAGPAVEVATSGSFVSKSKPEVNICFEGKAIVGKDFGKGELFHLVASRNATVANPDGSCTDTPRSGTVIICACNE